MSGVKTSVQEKGEAEEIQIRICRAVKGSFCSFFLIGDKPEEYLYESYETRSGQQVDLALGLRYSFIFAELEDCWITIGVNGGTAGTDVLPAIDLELLKNLADAVDYSRLSVRVDDSYLARIAEAQAEDEAQLQAALAEREAQEAAAAAQREEIQRELGYYRPDKALLPDELNFGMMGLDVKGKMLAWCGDDREMRERMILVDYVMPGEGYRLDLSYCRYDVNGISITAEAFEAIAQQLQTEEHDQQVFLSVSGNRALLIRNDDRAVLLWYDVEKDLLFFLETDGEAAAQSDEQLVAIAEHVRAEE